MPTALIIQFLTVYRQLDCGTRDERHPRFLSPRIRDHQIRLYRWAHDLRDYITEWGIPSHPRRRPAVRLPEEGESESSRDSSGSRAGSSHFCSSLPSQHSFSSMRVCEGSSSLTCESQDRHPHPLAPDPTLPTLSEWREKRTFEQWSRRNSMYYPTIQ